MNINVSDASRIENPVPHHSGFQSLKKLTQKSMLHSGFVSKQHEVFHDKLIEKAFKILCERIIRDMEREI